MWSTRTQSQPQDFFLRSIFVPKYKARALCQRLKSHSTQRKDANMIIIKVIIIIIIIIMIINGNAMYHLEKQ